MGNFKQTDLKYADGHGPGASLEFPTEPKRA